MNEKISMDEKLSKLKELFLSRSSLDKIFKFLDDTLENNFNDDNQILIYKYTFDNEIAREYPPAKSYCLKFYKNLIKKIEDSHNIVNELIYNQYIDLLNDKNDDEFHFTTYTINDDQFTFKQCDKLVTEGTTGLRLWSGGLQLFEQIFANKDRVFKNKRIMELGSGIGLSGILISALCELENYTFTDHHEKVINLIKDNLEINGFNLNKNSMDKKSNKFYQYEDDDGNNKAKYYEDDDKNNSYGGFGSFVRQGPMEFLEKKTEFSFNNNKSDDFFNYSNSFKNNSFDNEFEKSKDLFKLDNDVNEKVENFDKKVKNLNEQIENFEELLKSFEEKLSLLDENVNKFDNQNKFKKKLNSKTRNADVNVMEFDWFDSNSELIDKLTKINPSYVIGADIIYDPSIIKDLYRVFKLILSLESCSIIIVNCIRNEETIKQFEQQLRQLQKEDENIKIQRTKLSSKLTYFSNLELENTKFVLYNICNDDED